MPSELKRSASIELIKKCPQNDQDSINPDDSNTIEMGEFEDPWEDEFESESSDNEDQQQQNEDEEMIQQQEEEEEQDMADAFQVYLPGHELKEDEELVVDHSAYEMLHPLSMEWPCLSFDLIQDRLGMNRSKYPHSVYFVTGSQADNPKNNMMYVMKCSQLFKTNHSEEEEDDDDDEDLDEDPILEHVAIPHLGGINRLRVMPHPESFIVSTWSEMGQVHIYDLSNHVKSLDYPGTVFDKKPDPLYTVKSHGTEGFALEWSRNSIGQLLSGDLNGEIYLTRRLESGFATDSSPFTGHTSSVEDLQFSPNQSHVFASCSADKTIKIWDSRVYNKCQLSIVAHDSDVNVISWNRNVDYLLASGSDSGEFSIWDLRSWPSNPTPTPAASFKWHTKPITSIDWHPVESSVLAVSGADDQVTLWDLALERDAEEELTSDESLSQVPPQLLFIHQGQKHIKEIKWHSQIPGVLMSTSFDGFNIFKTINS